jgi:hypothetical protein
VNPESLEALPEVRRLIFSGEHKQAAEFADRALVGNSPPWPAVRSSCAATPPPLEVSAGRSISGRKVG